MRGEQASPSVPAAYTEYSVARGNIFRMHLHVGGQCLERLPRLGFGICRSHFDKEGPRERWWGFYGGTGSAKRDHLDRLSSGTEQRNSSAPQSSC